MKKNKALEKELREEFNNYLEKSHPDDRMTFVEYITGLGTFKGYRIKLKESLGFNLSIQFIQSC